MSYDGGKGGAGVAQWIINQIPPHRVFISAFLGNCAVLRAKRPAESSIGIEINSTIIEEYWPGHNIPGLQLVCGDALDFLRFRDQPGIARVIGPGTFVYLDPPYLFETRSQQCPLYANEFATIEQHRALLSLLRTLPCMVAISGYWSPLYELELAGWRSSTFQTVKRSGDIAEEWLWMNYPPPLELHDYRFLGRNFRERERIKRKKLRWTARLRTMPELERLCLMEAVAELRACIAIPGDEIPSPSPAMQARSTRSDDAHRYAAPDPTMPPELPL
jgi:hypothetical protein